MKTVIGLLLIVVVMLSLMVFNHERILALQEDVVALRAEIAVPGELSLRTWPEFKVDTSLELGE